MKAMKRRIVGSLDIVAQCIFILCPVLWSGGRAWEMEWLANSILRIVDTLLRVTFPIHFFQLLSNTFIQSNSITGWLYMYVDGVSTWILNHCIYFNNANSPTCKFAQNIPLFLFLYVTDICSAILSCLWCI